MKRCERRVEDDELALSVGDQYRVGHAGQCRLERRLVLAQLAFDPLSLGDVLPDAGDPHDRTIRSANRRQRETDVDDTSVSPLDPALVPRRAAGERILEWLLPSVLQPRLVHGVVRSPPARCSRTGARPRVPGLDHAVGGIGDDRVIGRFDECGEPAAVCSARLRSVMSIVLRSRRPPARRRATAPRWSGCR